MAIPIASLREPCIIVSAEATAAEVLAMKEEHASLFIITSVDEEGTNRPMAIATALDLRRLEKENQPLWQLKSQLPSLISIEEGAETVDDETLAAMAETLSAHPDVQGIFLKEHSSNISVLGRSKIASALPLELVVTRSRRLENASPGPEDQYVCRKCNPPSYRLCRTTDGPVPECQLTWFHGPMEIGGEPA